MKEFYISDDGIRLHSKLDMPQGWNEGDKCPLAIIIHGFTGHMEETHIKAVAKTFNELGIASLRVEMYGHGGSDGAFRNHNLFKWLNEAMTVTDYAKQLDFVTDLYICGHSQGGLTTVMLAGMKPDDFRAALPLSPAVHIEKGAKEGNMLGSVFDPLHIPEELEVSGRKLSGNYIRAAQMLDIGGAIDRFTKPVLIVHGDEDEAIPVSSSAEAAERYNDCRLVVIKGDDHCYNYHLEEVLEAIREFIRSLTIQ